MSNLPRGLNERDVSPPDEDRRTYSVQITTTISYIVEVEAVDEDEAQMLALDQDWRPPCGCDETERWWRRVDDLGGDRETEVTDLWS